MAEAAAQKRFDAAKSEPEAGSEAAGVFAALAAVVRDGLALAALEARRAGVGLAAMVGLGLGAGLLLASVWLLLAAAGVFALVHAGLGMPAALLLVAAVNLGVAGLFAWGVVRLSRRLLFRATRRQLVGGEGAADATRR